jgi:hypothetical protein
MLQRVLLATFSIRPIMPLRKPLIPPFSHFDPFGTEFREPGRVSHPDPNRQLQRTFELAPELHAPAREPRLNRSDAYLQRDCNLFISKTFNISQHDRFAVNALQ